MQSKYLRVTLVLSFFSILSFGFISANAQLAEEVRPFDFNDFYYKGNGIKAETLFGRKNGSDGQSVFDVTTDPSRFGNIRITATLPGYAADGSAIYWNHYGTATKETFTADAAGADAVEKAKYYSLFVFPSAVVRGTDRQAAMIPVDAAYFEKNPTGIAQVVVVKFEDRISKSGLKTLNMLAQRNGISVDGTPIIKTVAELEGLVKEALVTLSSDDSRPFAVAKVIQFPELGGITPDAFLMYVRQGDGQPLAAERHFVTKFECLQKGDRACL